MIRFTRTLNYGISIVCVVLIILSTTLIASCQHRKRITSDAAISFIEKSDHDFVTLSQELKHTDIIEYVGLHDLHKELKAAGLCSEGVRLERYFLCKDGNTVVSIQYFVTRHLRDMNKLHLLTLKRRAYGRIDLHEKMSLNAIVLSKEELEEIVRIMISDNTDALRELRARADRDSDVTIVDSKIQWKALSDLLK